MPFKEDAIKALEKVEDVVVRETLLNELELAHSIETAGLVNNKDELINEKKAIKLKLDEATAKLEASGGDKTAFADLNDRLNKLTADPGDAAKIAEVQTRADLAIKQLTEANQDVIRQKEATILEAETKNFKLNEEINAGLCTNALSAELDKANVLPDFKEILMRGLANDVYTEEVGDERKVKFKYAGANWGIAEGIQTWAKDPTNKKFVSATPNKGAGAQGSNGTDTYAGRTYASLDIEERTHLFRTDPAKLAEIKARG